MLASKYRVVVDGELESWCAAEFAPSDVDVGAGCTTITTDAIDQAALHAILERLAQLRLTLLHVDRVGSNP
jgi:hypothetical protein